MSPEKTHEHHIQSSKERRRCSMRTGVVALISHFTLARCRYFMPTLLSMPISISADDIISSDMP